MLGRACQCFLCLFFFNIFFFFMEQEDLLLGKQYSWKRGALSYFCISLIYLFVFEEQLLAVVGVEVGFLGPI